MKKVIIGLIAFALVAVSTIFVIGQFGSGEDKQAGKRGGMHRGGGMMFRALDLTDEQKAQVEQLRTAHEQSAAPIHEAMKANGEKLKAVTANGAFDEAAVTVIANEHGSLSAQMIVAREKMKSQVYALLNDEQKAKFAEMEKNHKGGFGERKGRRGGKHKGMGDRPAAEQPAN